MENREKTSEKDLPEGQVILLIEDNEDIAEFMSMALTEELRCRCVLARDGFEAVERTTTLVPDLLIIDYQLPGMDGLELYDRFQKREELQRVPTLFMSANLPTHELGKRGVFFLTKPFVVEELLQRVQVILKEREQSDLG